LLALGAGAASAGTNTFDTPVVLSATPGPGVWSPDRFAPAGFTVTNIGGTHGNVLQEIITAGDGQTAANSFYNTQGRSTVTDPGTTHISADIFVDKTWNPGNGRIAGLWAVGNNGVNSVPTDYGIIELENNGSGISAYGWNNVTSAFVDIGLPTGFTTNDWLTLGVTIDGSNLLYTVSDASHSVSLLSPDYATGNAGDLSTNFGAVILQNQNAVGGVTRNVMWDNVTTGGVPEPASWALMILGFGGVGAALRRRSHLAAIA
jgi:hypothetical protein